MYSEASASELLENIEETFPRHVVSEQILWMEFVIKIQRLQWVK